MASNLLQTMCYLENTCFDLEEGVFARGFAALEEERLAECIEALDELAPRPFDDFAEERVEAAAVRDPRDPCVYRAFRVLRDKPAPDTRALAAKR